LLSGQEFTLRRVGRFTQSMAVLAWGLGTVHAGWSPWDGPLLSLTGVIFLAIALEIWRIGVYHYRSTGS
jgi:hypothetical protein